MDAPPPPPPPPPAALQQVQQEAFLGLTDIGRAFVASGQEALDQKAARERVRLKSLEVTGAEGAQFDVSQSVDLSGVEWAKCVRVDCSTGGSGGVFFLTLEDGRKCVIKGSMENAREIFAMRCFRQLGIACPHIRLVSYWELEYAKITETIKRLAHGDIEVRAGKQLNRPQISLQEFVGAAHGLPETPLVMDFLSLEKNPEAADRVLREIAAVVAVDCLFNNFDRVPINVWDNDGNFGNVLLQSGANGSAVPKVVALDNGLFPIKKEISGKPNPQYARFLTRLGNLVSGVKRTDGTESEAVRDFREKFLFGTGITLGPKEGLVFQAGLLTMFKKLAALDLSFFQREKDFVSQMVSDGRDWQNVWAKDCESISIPFIEDALKCIKANVE